MSKQIVKPYSYDSCYLFSCGLNHACQLGRDNTDSLASVPLNLSKDCTIVKVACGGYFTCILLSDHRVFFCGENSHGECGSFFEKTIMKPQESLFFRKLRTVDIQCGYHFTVFITESGEFYACGDIIGFQQKIEKIKYPACVDDVSHIAAGGYTLAFLNKARNKLHLISLGQEKTLDCTNICDEKIQQVCCMYQGMLLLTESGKIYKATDSLPDESAFQKQNVDSVITLATCYYHYYCQTSDFEIYKDGIIRLYTKNGVKITEKVEISCGGYHTWIRIPSTNQLFFSGESRYGESGIKELIKQDLGTELIELKFPMFETIIEESTNIIYPAHGMGCFSWFWVSSKSLHIEQRFPKLLSNLLRGTFNDVEIFITS
jgi:alpha-tubulin suppressor-like RCC1 family protein